MNPTDGTRKADSRFAELEIKAQRLLGNREQSDMDHGLNDAKDLIHQLQVYQAELEIQNEELRDAQEALLISRDRLSHLYHQAPTGYISIDKHGFIREVNQRCLNMFHVTMDESLNKPLVDFIRNSDRAIFLGRFRAFFEVPEGKSMEICLERGDGSSFYALLEGRLDEPAPDSRAKDKVLMLLTITDITVRRAAEANLRLADEIIHSAQESILVTDPHGTILNVNPCFEKTTGYAKSEIIGKNPSLLQSGRQSRSFYDAMWQQLLGSGFWQGIVWNRRKDGEEYAEKLSINAIYSERKEITHFIGMFTDITDQLDLEEKLRQSQKMEAIGTLVGGIAHDFNNMLAGMVGNLYLAKRKITKQEDVHAHLEVIEILCDRAAQMIAQMLIFAREGVVRMEQISLNDCINDILAAVGRVSIPENIQLNVDIGQQNLIVKADKTQMQQLVINLLNNARDALTDQKQSVIGIRLTKYCADKMFLLEHDISEPTNFAHLTVSDNGIGIDSEKLAHIFEPFYTTKATGKGTGLGLAMVYGVVQTHGGVTKIESTPGQGTRFHLYLPLLDAVLESDKDETLHVMHGQGETVLVVDDEDVVRSVTVEALNEHGYRVMQASDGASAWKLFEAHYSDIDLILMDVIMPEMNGDEVAQKVRQLSPDVPIIFMTGYDKEHVMTDNHLLDKCYVLTKPFQQGQLSHLLRRALLAD